MAVPAKGSSGSAVTAGATARREGRLMLVMGDDLAGVDDRYEAELEALSTADPADASQGPAGRFPQVTAATAYIVSSGLFDPAPRLGIGDCAEALRSNEAGRSARRELVAALAANPQASVVMRLGKRPTRTAAEQELADAVRTLGGEVVIVDVPRGRTRVPWLLGYAERHGTELTEDAATRVLTVIGDGDVSIAAELVRSLGEELNAMSRPELQELVPSASESTYTRLRQAIVARDVVALEQCRHELPEGPAGDRQFAVKSRYALQRLLIASSIDWSRKDVLAHAKGSYGDRYAATLMREAAGSGGRERYARAYSQVCSLIAAMTGFGDGEPPTMGALMAALVG